jgi:hypothetical protein
VDDPDRGELTGQTQGDLQRPVGTGVVGDRDLEGVRERAGQVLVQAGDAADEIGLLVVDRDHDVEHRAGARLTGFLGPPLRGRHRHVVHPPLADSVVHMRPLCAPCVPQDPRDR